MRLRDFTWIEWFVVSIIALILTLCGFVIWSEVRGLAVKAGIVDSKQYHPSWIEYQYTGDKGQYMIPIYHDESFSVYVVGVTPEGEERIRTVRVSGTTFERVKVGQKWSEKGGFE